MRARECEVTDREGRWYSLRVRPYLTLDNKVDGAVLMLVDIDALKRNERAIAEARDYAEAIVRTVRDPLLILDSDLRVHTANAAFYEAFRMSSTDVEGRSIYDLGNGRWNIPRLRGLLEEILPRNSFFDDFEVTQDFEGIGRRTMLLNARTLAAHNGEPARILLGIEDVTEQLRFQTRQHHSPDPLPGPGAGVRANRLDHRRGGAVVEDSPTWRAFTGQTYEQWKGFGWLDALHPDDRERVAAAWQHTARRAHAAGNRLPDSARQRRLALDERARRARAGRRWRRARVGRHEHRHHRAQGGGSCEARKRRAIPDAVRGGSDGHLRLRPRRV